MKIKNLKYVGNLLMIVSILFIVRSLMKIKLDFNQVNMGNTIFWLVVLSLLATLFVYGGSIGWYTILGSLLKRKIDLYPVMDVYIRANIGKYLPGNVMHFAERNMFGQTLGLSQTSMVAGTIIEIVMLVLSTVVMSLAISFESFVKAMGAVYENPTLSEVFILICGIIIVFMVVLFVFMLKKKKLRQTIVNVCFNIDFIKMLIKTFFIYSASIFITSIVYVCIFQFILEQQVAIGLVISAQLLSWVIGYVIPGAPGGIGIRESVLILLLSGQYGISIITISVVLLRITNILGDTFAFILNMFVRKKLL